MNYVKNCGESAEVATCRKPFRHNIGVPGGFFPQQWLDREVDEVPKFTWDLPPLKPGEIKQMRVLETGDNPMTYGHRVGLPENFSQKMMAYADRSGITNIMRKYVTGGQPLELEGEERTRINGGVRMLSTFDTLSSGELTVGTMLTMLVSLA